MNEIAHYIEKLDLLLTPEEMLRIWWSRTDIAKEDIEFWVSKADSYPRVEAIAKAQLTKARPLIEKAERERIIAVIESYNSISYPYGADFKATILQVLKDKL